MSARPVSAVALGSWLILSAAAAAFVARYGAAVPTGDDWELLPAVAGVVTVGPAWSWRQDHEWREPLPRLAVVGLLRATGGALHGPKLAGVALLSAAAWWLMAASRAARGRASWTDAFYPLALLHWGHARPLQQIAYFDYALTAALLSLVLAVALRTRGRIDRRGAWLGGGALLALPLSGALGEAAAPPIALWLAWSGWTARRTDRGAGTVSLGLVAVAAAVWLAYLVGYRWPAEVPPPPGPGAAARTALQVVAMALGPAGRAGWPATPVLVLLAVGAGAVAAGAALRFREPRPAGAGVLAVLGSVLLAAAAIGFGRSGFGREFGLMDRYVTAAVPLLCAAYAALDLHGASPARIPLQAGLCLLMFALLPVNARDGLGKAKLAEVRDRRLADDVATGMSERELSARHWHYYSRGEGRFLAMLAIARRSGLAPFRRSSP